MKRQSTLKEVQSALENRKSSKALRNCIRVHGETAVYIALNNHLGDLPEGLRIRKTAVALNLPEADLRRLADSPEEAIRRIARLILLESKTGISEDPLLQKGISDKSPLIRSDAARFTGTGSDRTRLYNQLIRLIREDPDQRVRKAAGKRLADSFADLYSVDFSGLPPLSRMLIIDALGGHSREDEERTESLLSSEDRETAFRAARTLQSWGTLTRFFNSSSGGQNDILRSAAELGIADYLEDVSVNDSNREMALQLAMQAGRKDLEERFRAVENSSEQRNEAPAAYPPDIIRMVQSLLERNPRNREEEIKELPLENPGFRKTVELVFPHPEGDISGQILFHMARLGKWKGWTNKCIRGIDSGDPEIQCSSIKALGILNPEKALKQLPSLLTSETPEVAETAAGTLASISRGEGPSMLVEYLMDSEKDENREAVISGIRNAGGAAVIRCVTEESIDTETAGELLKEGTDAVGAEILADSFEITGNEKNLKNLLEHAGYLCGRSILLAWPALGDESRRKYLSALSTSSWAESIPREKDPGLIGILKELSREEKKSILEPGIRSADGRRRRQIRKLMKS